MTQTPPSEPEREAAGGAQSPIAKPAWSKDIRAFYDAAVQEPVPQAFEDLMAQIAKQITK